MSDTTPDAKGPAPVQLAAETTDPALIPADQVKPEDVGTLSIEYRDGQPVIVVSGGKYISAGLAVLDRSGQPAATYTITSSQSPEPGRGSYMRRIEISKDNTTIIDGSGEAITIEAR